MTLRLMGVLLSSIIQIDLFDELDSIVPFMSEALL